MTTCSPHSIPSNILSASSVSRFTLNVSCIQCYDLDIVTIQCISGKIECSQLVPSRNPQTVHTGLNWRWPINNIFILKKTVELQGCFIKTSKLMLQWPLPLMAQEEKEDHQEKGHKNSKRKQTLKRPASTRAGTKVRASKRP